VIHVKRRCVVNFPSLSMSQTKSTRLLPHIGCFFAAICLPFSLFLHAAAWQVQPGMHSQCNAGLHAACWR
jgi:hypothetical protein